MVEYLLTNLLCRLFAFNHLQLANQTKICCHLPEFRLLASKFLTIVLGGTAALHTCSGVGGGHFLIKKLSREDRTNSATLIFFLAFFDLIGPYVFPGSRHFAGGWFP